MFEADATSPPTMGDQQTKQPANPNAKPQTLKQQQQGNPQMKKIEEEKKPVTSAFASNDLEILTHATNVAVAIMSVLQSMTNDAYSVVSAFYPSLTNRKNAQNQSQQNSQQQ